QQHLDPRTRLHAGINRKLPLEWTAQDFYGIAKPRHRRLEQFNQAATLSRPNFGNDGVRDTRRLRAVHHQANDARPPARALPLHLNENERIGGEKQRRLDYLATLHGAALTQPRGIGFKAGLRKEMKRQALAHGLQLRGCPIHAGGLERALAAVLEPRLVPLPAGRHMLRLRMIKSALHVADDATEDAVADQLPPSAAATAAMNGSRSAGYRAAAALAMARNCGWLSGIGMGVPHGCAVGKSARWWSRLLLFICLAPGQPPLAG